MSRLPSAMSDAELAQRVAGGCGRSFAELERRYRGLRLGIAGEFFFVGHSRDDVRQEALIGLHVAACGFDASKHASFPTFANLVIRRRLQTAVKGALRGRARPLSESVRFGHPLRDVDAPIDEVLPAVGADPSEIFEVRQRLERLAQLPSQLSALETRALGGWLSGHTYEQIGAELGGASRKAIDNALQRVKRKAREWAA